ncbi:MAG: hypothetical protein IE909_02985 [Campylobacterales bacterium]|nr:hypothetical protein [Campylobacterales bacterium]
MKKITFHINNAAYTVDIGEDSDNALENGLKKFLPTDKNISTEELLLAYLRKTQEFLIYKDKLEEIMQKIPSLEKFGSQ